jgi:hypothetical protein
VTAVAVSDEEADVENERVVLSCFVGPNWLLTVHAADVAVIDEFRDTVSGEASSEDSTHRRFSRTCSSGWSAVISARSMK